MNVSPEKRSERRERIVKPYDAYLNICRLGWITQRDVEILDLLFKFRFLTITQIKTLKFPGKFGIRSANRRMLKLYQCNTVDRFRSWTEEQRATEYIYSLDQVGIYFVGHHRQSPVVDLAWRKRDNEVRMSYVHHYLMAADVFIKIRRQVNITRFEPQPTIPGKATFRPDAYLEYSKGGYRYHWFVEVDRGTEGKQKIVEKVQNYEAYYRANKGKEKFIMPYIVFVTTGPVRVEELKRWITPARQVDLEYHVVTMDGLKPIV